MSSGLKKLYDALRLYKTGIFRIFINKYFSGFFSSESMIIYNYNLQEKDEIKSGDNDQVVIKKIEQPQGLLFKKFRKKFPAKEFVSRLNQENKTCYIALSDGEVAGYAWVAINELFIDSLHYNYPMKKDELFIYACYVSKKNRGQGIYPEMLRFILNDSKKLNFRCAYIGVSSSNAGSIRGIEKAGFEKSGKLRFLKVLSYEKLEGMEGRRAKSIATDSKVVGEIHKNTASSKNPIALKKTD